MMIPIHLFEKILESSKDNDLLILYNNSRLFKKPKDIWRNTSIIQVDWYLKNDFTEKDKIKSFTKVMRHKCSFSIFLFLYKNIPEYSRMTTIIDEACKYNRLDVIKFLTPTSKVRETAYWFAICNKNIKLFEYLYNIQERKLSTNKRMCDTITEYAAQTSLKLLKFLEKLEIPTSKKALDDAIECDKFDIIVHLIESGQTFSKDALEMVIMESEDTILLDFLLVFNTHEITREMIESSGTSEMYTYLNSRIH